MLVNTTKELSTELPKRLRAKHIVEEFGISIATVWNYSKQGKLTPIRVSSRVTVFDTEEVINLFSHNFDEVSA